MRLDHPPTVPAILPAFRAYQGAALRPFLEAPQVRPEVLTRCAELAVEHGDAEGLRLARLLMRLGEKQRRGLRRGLTPVNSVS